MKYKIFFLIFCWYSINEVKCGILPLMLLPKGKFDMNQNETHLGTISTAIAHRFADSQIEYQKNGTITLRSDFLENSTNWQNLVLFKTILKAIKLAAPFAAIDASKDTKIPKINIKIYGEGIEHKFPPFLENIIQRIQTYFSVYRYTDTNRPVKQEFFTTTIGTSGTSGTSSPLTYSSINNNLDENFLTTTMMNGGGGGVDSYDYPTDFESTPTFIDANADYDATTADYNDFISIDENNDGFITVGED